MEGLVVLSLFDGMACGYQALKQAGIPVKKYYASEIDSHVIKVAMKNHPDIIQLGDIKNWRDWGIEQPDLIMGGSPCQGFSFAGKQLAFDDPRSALFFEMITILNYHNPKFRFLENVKMKKDYLDVITDLMNCEPMFINSALVSAQNRQRYYWFNWDAPMPEDKGVVLSDILEDLPDCPIGIHVREKSNCIRTGDLNSPLGGKHVWDSPFQRISKKGIVKKGIDKASCLTGGAHSGGNHSDMDIIHSKISTRRYSIAECETLQGLPKGYTSGVSNTQRYKMLGNGWQGDTITHLFKSMPAQR
jgi:site-specific DNA-cytosine methylase